MASAFKQALRAYGDRVRLKFQNEPLSVARIMFWVVVWVLAVCDLATATRLFRDSLSFVLSNNTTSLTRGGLEDFRRQAIPALVMAAIILVLFMPFLVGLPLCGRALLFNRYIVEASWSLLVLLLILGGAAALSPVSSSPHLPIHLQPSLSATLGLSFTLFILLAVYNLLLVGRLTFLLGKGIPNPHCDPISTLLYPELQEKTTPRTKEGKITPFSVDVESGDPQLATEKPEEANRPVSPRDTTGAPPGPNQVRRGTDGSIEIPGNASIRTLSSGWDDDDEDEKPGKKFKRKAKSKSTPPTQAKPGTRMS